MAVTAARSPARLELVGPLAVIPAYSHNTAARLAHRKARLLQQLRQSADDAVGTDRRVVGQTDAVAVVPDRIDAEPLGCDDLPFKVVANHPRLVRTDPEHFHRMFVGPRLGLPEAVLALDLDVVETVFESKPHDFGALRVGCAV